MRDWLGRVAAQLFCKDHGLMDSCVVDGVEYLFISNYVDQAARFLGLDADTLERFFRTLGLVCALSVRRSVPLGVVLAPHLCKALLGETPGLADLRFVCPLLHESLQRCVDEGASAAEREDAVEELRDALGNLTFDVTSREMEMRAAMGLGVQQQQGEGEGGALLPLVSELCEGGAGRRVEVGNVGEYVAMVVQKRLVENVASMTRIACESFQAGITEEWSPFPGISAVTLAVSVMCDNV